jgi:Phage integrase family
MRSGWPTVVGSGAELVRGRGFSKPAVRVAGLPEALRLYDLRHTCASLLIAQGASVKAVQAQLGHATASITLDTYGHLFPSELEALADRLEQVRTAALANRVRTQRGPAVVNLAESAGSRGGGGGIRTHGALSGPATFKVAAFGRSATPPGVV